MQELCLPRRLLESCCCCCLPAGGYQQPPGCCCCCYLLVLLFPFRLLPSCAWRARLAKPCAALLGQ